MPKAKRYTEKRFVMLTPAQARQLERLSQHQEMSVPELIRTALRQHYGLPDGIRPPAGAVRYQGTLAIELTREWNHSAELSGLFPEAARGLSWAVSGHRSSLSHSAWSRTRA